MSLEDLEYINKAIRVAMEVRDILGVADLEEIPDKIRGLSRDAQHRDEAVQGRAAREYDALTVCLTCGTKRKIIGLELEECTSCFNPRRVYSLGKDSA